MPMGMLYWMCFLIWAVFGFYTGYNGDPVNRRSVWGGNFLLLVLLFLIGWKVFGFAVKE